MIAPGSFPLNVNLQVKREPEVCGTVRIFATRSRGRLVRKLPGSVLITRRRDTAALEFVESEIEILCWSNVLSRVLPLELRSDCFTPSHPSEPLPVSK